MLAYWPTCPSGCQIGWPSWPFPQPWAVPTAWGHSSAAACLPRQLSHTSAWLFSFNDKGPWQPQHLVLPCSTFCSKYLSTLAQNPGPGHRFQRSVRSSLKIEPAYRPTLCNLQRSWMHGGTSTSGMTEDYYWRSIYSNVWLEHVWAARQNMWSAEQPIYRLCLPNLQCDLSLEKAGTWFFQVCNQDQRKIKHLNHEILIEEGMSALPPMVSWHMSTI